MRLLNTTTKELKTFYGEAIPRYAILSHMWGGDEDEVLFRHIAGSDADKREGEKRKGYAKIQGACKQAIEDGWEYIWIDTCCIDKTSSAELSEAINSMFEWYWKSEVCYVYLEDVVSDGDRQVESNEDIVFPIVAFKHSRWFTRGWTLQELIAPQFVVFYSKDWVDIGTKASLQNTISDVTRIRIEMLLWYDPEKASVAEKISWAAFRKTTRAEDATYCLMGLLGVNMPLLYGEGDRAFRRLQEEFMKASDDDSLFAWKSHFTHLKDSRGMLANSPWEFRDGANIKRSKDGAYSPYSMSNQGLQIKLPLLPIDPKLGPIGVDSENTFKTILKCSIRNQQPTRRIVIYLKKITEGYYQRVLPHWLDETETPPNATVLSTLLVPQAGTLMTRNRSRTSDIEVKILPTKSGFTANGHTLAEGYRYDLDIQIYNKVGFEHKEKSEKKPFAVAIGSDEGIPWLDFTDDISSRKRGPFGFLFKDPYEKGGSRAHLRQRHLDRLSEKIPGKDWWLTVSVRKINDIQRGSLFQAVIDIHRDRVQVKGWYIPPAIPVSDSFSGDFPDNLDHLHLFKKESHDWVAMFNPKVKRVLDIDLVTVYTLPNESNSHYTRFSRDGKYLVKGTSEDGVVRVFDTETGAEKFSTVRHTAKETFIVGICFSPDGKFLAMGDFHGCIELWDIGAECIYKSLHEKRIYSVEFLCFSSDGRFLITGLNFTVRIWEIDNGTSRTFIMGPNEGIIASIAVSHNDRLVAAGTSNGIIRIWDIATTRLLEDSLKHGDSDVSAIAFTPDRKGLVSGSHSGTLKYWDISRLDLVPTGVNIKFDRLNDSEASSMVASSNSKKAQHGMTLTGHKQRVTLVAVSHDGRWVISGSVDGCVLFWDLSDATPQFILKTQTGWMSPLFSTSPAGNTTFATFEEENNRVRVWRYSNI